MSVTIVEEPDFIRVTLTGVLTKGDLDEVVVGARRLEEGRDHVPHRLTDMRGVSQMEVAYPEVKNLADERRILKFPNAFRSAIVVNSAVQSGMARMFRTLNDNPQISIEIFEEEPAAICWLGQG